MNTIHFELFKTLLMSRLNDNPKLNINSDIVFDELYNTSRVLSEKFINRTILLEKHQEQLTQLLTEQKNGT